MQSGKIESALADDTQFRNNLKSVKVDQPSATASLTQRDHVSKKPEMGHPPKPATSEAFHG